MLTALGANPPGLWTEKRVLGQEADWRPIDLPEAEFEPGQFRLQSESAREKTTVSLRRWTPSRRRNSQSRLGARNFAERTASRARVRLAKGLAAVPGFASSPFGATWKSAALAVSAAAIAKKANRFSHLRERPPQHLTDQTSPAKYTAQDRRCGRRAACHSGKHPRVAVDRFHRGCGR